MVSEGRKLKQTKTSKQLRPLRTVGPPGKCQIGSERCCRSPSVGTSHALGHTWRRHGQMHTDARMHTHTDARTDTHTFTHACGHTHTSLGNYSPHCPFTLVVLMIVQGEHIKRDFNGLCISRVTLSLQQHVLYCECT